MKNELEIKRKDGIIVKGKFKFLEEKDKCVIIIEFNNKIGSIDSKQVDNYTYASLNF